jgi:XTP/dITP diphosphohydrolase
MRRLYLASNNRHKAEELAALAGGLFDVRIAKELDPAVTWDETGDTFLANAKIKADVVSALVRAKAPGAAVLADDSGLCVDALGGAPGVHSSRYAGVDGDDAANNAKLLRALDGVPSAERTARFVCTLYFVDAAGVVSTFVGVCPGRILTAPRGAQGFGYDPLFQCDGETVSMAEMTAAAKNAVSHRGRAMQQWLAALRAR